MHTALLFQSEDFANMREKKRQFMTIFHLGFLTGSLSLWESAVECLTSFYFSCTRTPSALGNVCYPYLKHKVEVTPSHIFSLLLFLFNFLPPHLPLTFSLSFSLSLSFPSSSLFFSPSLPLSFHFSLILSPGFLFSLCSIHPTFAFLSLYAISLSAQYIFSTYSLSKCLGVFFLCYFPSTFFFLKENSYVQVKYRICALWKLVLFVLPG